MIINLLIDMIILSILIFMGILLIIWFVIANKILLTSYNKIKKVNLNDN